MPEIQEMPKFRPTKDFLLKEIEYLQKQVAQNEGALNFCVNMLKSGCYIDEEVKQNGGN